MTQISIALAVDAPGGREGVAGSLTATASRVRTAAATVTIPSPMTFPIAATGTTVVPLDQPGDEWFWTLTLSRTGGTVPAGFVRIVAPYPNMDTDFGSVDFEDGVAVVAAGHPLIAVFRANGYAVDDGTTQTAVITRTVVFGSAATTWADLIDIDPATRLPSPMPPEGLAAYVSGLGLSPTDASIAQLLINGTQSKAAVSAAVSAALPTPPPAITYTLAKVTGDAPTVPYTAASFLFIGNGPKALATGNHYANNVGNNTMTVVEWFTDAPAFTIRLNGSKLTGSLFVDGVRINNTDISTDNLGLNYALTVTCGTEVKTRRIRWVATNQSFGGLIVDAAYNVWKPSLRKPLAWWLGDSYTQGTGAMPYSETAAATAMRELGWEGVTDGWGGSGWTGPETSPDGVQGPNPAARIRAKLVPLSYDPDYIVFDLLYNNRNTAIADIITGLNDAVAAARLDLPNARIFVMGAAFPLGTAALPGLVDRHNAVRDRCIVLGLDFIDTSGYITTGNRGRYTGADNEHPTPAGHIYLGKRKAAALADALTHPAPTPGTEPAPIPDGGVSGWDHIYLAARLGLADGATVSTWPDLGTAPSALLAGTVQAGSVGTTTFVADTDGGFVRLASTAGNSMLMATADTQASPRSVSLLVRTAVAKFAFLGAGGRLSRASAGGWQFTAIGTGNGGQINLGASSDAWTHVLVRSDGAMFVNGVKTTPSSWTPGAVTTLRLLASEAATGPTDVKEMRSIGRVVTDTEAAAIYAATQTNYTSI